MNQFHFEVERSKVKVTAGTNVLFWRRHTDQWLAIHQLVNALQQMTLKADFIH